MITVAIVDYGLANIRSVVNAFSCFAVDVIVADDPAELKSADRIVLPGVGSFDAGMRGLRARGHDEALRRRVIEDGVPFMGICLGLQFLFTGSEEGSEAGLGWLDGTVRRFPSGKGQPKVPHMGWDRVEPRGGARLFRDLMPPFDFYFVHSYFVPAEGTVCEWAAGLCRHGIPFVAALERENIYAVQFHPEKSQLTGLKLVDTFLTA